MKPSIKTIHYTVKLKYNELGYNEHSVITRKCSGPKWPLCYINQPVYNEPRLQRTNLAVRPSLTVFEWLHVYFIGSRTDIKTPWRQSDKINSVLKRLNLF